MALAAGVLKSVRIKKETVFNTLAGATDAFLLRRVTSNVGLVKNAYESQEIVSDFQITDFRHGTRRVEGSINGELSPGTYALLMAAAMRRDFTAGESTGALTDVTAAAGPPGTFTRATGDYLADGFRVGDIVRWTGFVGATGNNGRNYRITALSATVMTVPGLVDEVVTADAAGDSVTCTVVGKKTFTPLTAHTNDSFGIEEWFSDIEQSEVFGGCRVNTMGIQLPATGLATCNYGILGANIIRREVTAYYTTPTAAPSTGITVAVSGALRVNNVDVAVVTGITLEVNGGMTTLDVVGSNFTPDVFAGRVRITGQITAGFQDASLRDLFIDETEADIAVYLRLSSAIDSDFLSFYLARVKVGGATRDDGEKSIIQTMPFQSLKRTSTGSGAYEQTSMSIQDSTLV